MCRFGGGRCWSELYHIFLNLEFKSSSSVLRNFTKWYAAPMAPQCLLVSKCIPKDRHRRQKILLVCPPYGEKPALAGLPLPSDTCIKGHRSSACKHTDRPLFEIQKKGRPVTQCPHCRELRKTKQVHIKCTCADTRPGKGDPGSGEPPYVPYCSTLQLTRTQLPRKRMIPRSPMESPSTSPLSSL